MAKKTCCGCFGRKPSKRGDANLDSSDDEAYGFPSLKRSPRHGDVTPADTTKDTYIERKDTSITHSQPGNAALAGDVTGINNSEKQ